MNNQPTTDFYGFYDDSMRVFYKYDFCDWLNEKIL